MNKLFILFLLLFLSPSCAKIMHVTGPQSDSVKIEEAAQIEPAASVENLILPYKQQLEKEMNEVIGFAVKDLQKARPESTLGNWLADLIHQKCEEYYGQKIDFALVNYGGIRIPTLSQGEITRSTIFELMPFDNMLVVVSVDGNTLLELFDLMAKYGGWPVSKEVRYKIENDKAVNLTLDGKQIDKNKIYKIALSDFIANGGDKCYFLKDKKQEKLGKLFRDAILEYVEEQTAEGKKMDAEIEGRVVR